jgi:hypothetical protein
MKVNGKRIWEISTDHSIGMGRENHAETLATKLGSVLDKNNIKNIVKYSDYRVEVEVFDFSDMCAVVNTLNNLLEEKKYKLTGIKVISTTY